MLRFGTVLATIRRRLYATLAKLPRQGAMLITIEAPVEYATVCRPGDRPFDATRSISVNDLAALEVQRDESFVGHH